MTKPLFVSRLAMIAATSKYACQVLYKYESTILYEQHPNKISDQITRKLSGKTHGLIETTTAQ